MPGQVGPGTTGGGGGGGTVTGSGTTNTVAKFTGAGAVGNSRITDVAGNPIVFSNSTDYDGKIDVYASGDYNIRALSDDLGTQALLTKKVSEAGNRFELQIDGAMAWGDGTGPYDTLLLRSGAAALTISAGTVDPNTESVVIDGTAHTVSVNAVSGLKLNGGTGLVGQAGSGTSIVTNTAPTITGLTATGTTLLEAPRVGALPGTATAGQLLNRTTDDTFWGVSPANTFNQLWAANTIALGPNHGAGVNAQTGTTYTFDDNAAVLSTNDRGKLVTFTNGSAIAVTLPQAGASSEFAAGWYVDVQNRGVGTATITPTTSTIDGAASLALTTGQGVRIFSDGTNYFTQRGIGSAGGTTINASDTVIPYRSNSTTFTDSPLSVVAGRLISTASTTSSGVAPYFRVITPADTGQTVDTEFTGAFFGGDASGATVVRTGADGTTIAIQRENRFIGPTYAFAGATTITDVFTVSMTPPVVGTNATFTRNHTLGILDATNTSSSTTGGLIIAAAFGTAATSVGIGGGNINAGGTIISASDIFAGAAGEFRISSRSRISSAVDGNLRLTNNGQSAFSLLQFGGVTNSFNALGHDAVNGFTIQSGAGTATYNDASTAGSGTVSNRYLFGIAAPTLTATNASVTNTVASTFFIGDAPTDSTNVTSTAKYALNVDLGLVRIGGIGSDATHTDSTVCQDTTTHALYAGSGAVGICLGTSSRRYKEGIREETDGLNEVLELQPVRFRFDAHHGDGGAKEHSGFTAEDIAATKLARLVDLDKEGRPNAYDWSELFPVLVNSIKELYAQNQALNARLDTIYSR